MSNDQSVDNGRRGAIIATSVVGGIGAVCTAVPFVSTFAPSEKARAAGAPIEVDIGQLKEGELIVAEWRGKPVWILKRSKEMLDSLAKTEPEVADPKSERKASELTPEYCRNQARSIKPDVLVAVGICSHLGCSPSGPFAPGANPALPGPDWGFVCPCHGSTFDLAGRVFKGKPAPDNLEVPPHMYLSETKLLVGEDKKGA
jgi:ubiquinol-cytochrome c reductase iron-sulfur subunit